MIELNTTQAGLAGQTARTSVDKLSILKSAFVDRGANRILDIGCGNGTLAEALHGYGYSVTGIEPAPGAVDQARKRLPAAKFRCALAEAPPTDMGQFDAAYFGNSLHHVQPDHMQAALLNATSVARRNVAALARAWRNNIRSIGGLAALIQPMICWTLAEPRGSRR